MTEWIDTSLRNFSVVTRIKKHFINPWELSIKSVYVLEKWIIRIPSNEEIFTTFLKILLDYEIYKKSKLEWNIKVKNLYIKKSKFNLKNTKLSRNHEITYISEHLKRYLSFRVKSEMQHL